SAIGKIQWPSLEQLSERIIYDPVLGNIAGYIDGTRHKIQRPIHRQKIYYSGKQKYHCLTSTFAPLIGDLFFKTGYFGSYHDAKLFIQAKVAEQCPIPEGSWLLGDRGFANKPPVLTPFRSNEVRRVGLTEQQRLAFNNRLSHYRIGIEHVTKDIKLHKVI
ncbi:unnamed protein product, partial [Didymodactylos carnosus]